MNELREAAIEYAMRGWAVFPLKPKSKHPNGNLVHDGYREASTFPPDCLYWWERAPDGNIGLACNQSGFVVIDIDERHGGYDTMHDWEMRYSKKTEPIAWCAQLTPTGGVHYLFKHPGVPLKGQLGPGVDIKDHGYILGAPSVHPQGGEYVWESDPIPDPPPMPEAWVAALQIARVEPRNFSLRPSDEPLLQIPAAEYVPILTGREIVNGWTTCPFHRDGEERTPSFKVNGTMWACFGCEPMPGKQVMGGNMLDLEAMLKNYALPLRGTDLHIVKAHLEVLFRVSSSNG